jgi:hypothetical protein
MQVGNALGEKESESQPATQLAWTSQLSREWPFGALQGSEII